MEPKEIHDRLKQLRESQEMSQTELAKLLGVTPSYVSAMERGAKNITRKVVEKLIELFKVSADWLISGSDTIGLKPLGLPILPGQVSQPPKTAHLGTQKQSNEKFNSSNVAAAVASEADAIHNTVQAAAVGGDAARRWANRRFMEARLYKKHPSASSDTLNDYFLTSQLGQYVDQLLVLVHNTAHKRIDQILDKAIDNELTMPQAAAEIEAITAPLNKLQAPLEGLETAIFGMVRATVEQYPEMLETVKGTPLYYGMQEWLEGLE